MPEQKQEIIVAIIAIVTVLIFLGILFLYMSFYYNARKKQIMKEKDQLRAELERQSLASQLEIQEQVFNAVSREIHDNVGQILSLAKVQLSIIEQRANTPELLVGEVKSNITRALTDLRDIAKSLNSERLSQNTLASAVYDESERFNKLGHFLCEVKVSGSERGLCNEKKLILFRVIQEALNNTLKHAQAKNMFIDLCFSDNSLEAEIRDDGIGFDFRSQHSRGLGLQNMVSRIGLSGGSADIHSAPGTGVRILIKMPYGG